MNILYLTPAYPPFPGGGERYVAALAHNLAERGHQLTVVTSAANFEVDFWQGQQVKKTSGEKRAAIEIIRCPLRPFFGGRRGLLAWRKLMVLLSELPGEQTAVLQQMARAIPPIQNLEKSLTLIPQTIEIVHAFNISWEYTMLAGWQLAKERHLPFVATPFTHLGVKGADRVARNSTMDHQMKMLRNADCILTLTQIEKEGLLAWHLPREKVNVIWGGIEKAAADTMDPPVAMPTAPYVIFVGRASYDKGAIHAAQAVNRLRAKGIKIALVLVGQSTNEFQTYLNKLSSVEKSGIHHYGICTDEEKHILMSNAQMLLLPSRTDSFGLVLLEAWSHSLPVIGARAGGIPDVIDEGKNGLLVDFGDVEKLAEAVQHLLENKSVRVAFGEAGHQKIETTFTWQRVGDRVLQHYETLLSKFGNKQD